MTDVISDEIVYDIADRLLLQGQQPTDVLIATELSCEAAAVEPVLAGWWAQVPNRLSNKRGRQQEQPVPGVPEVLSQAFARIWDQAVQEARAMKIVEQKNFHEYSLGETRRINDEGLKKQQEQLLDLEGRYRALQARNEEFQAQVKGLEAEVKVLKANLATEMTGRKQEEQKRNNVEQELAHLRKSYDDAKRTFDQRIKDEQRHTLEAVSKADADVRYYRGALEKVRDEAGKKEAALTKNIHDLQAESAKKDVKIETFRTQVKSLEVELKNIKQDSTGRNRDLSTLNSQLLAETNKNKRLTDKVAELEEEMRRQRQKQIQGSTEQTRRENSLRVLIKERDEDLMRSQAKVSSLEKRIITQDEEIRRLNARL